MESVEKLAEAVNQEPEELTQIKREKLLKAKVQTEEMQIEKERESDPEETVEEVSNKGMQVAMMRLQYQL